MKGRGEEARRRGDGGLRLCAVQVTLLNLLPGGGWCGMIGGGRGEVPGRFRLG